jgi:hypothetical protein
MAPPPPPPRRTSPFTILSVVVIVALAVGAVGFIATRNRHHGPPHPTEWDARVLPLVQFDEAHRGLKFKQPVFVDFLTADEYSKRTRDSTAALTDAEKADRDKQLATSEGELRALGLVAGPVDLGQAGEDLADSGTLAFYDPDTERVTVRGTDLTVDLRVTLAHELTHVLQDQYYGIKSSRFNAFKTSQERDAFRTLLEGDAVRIENEYVDSLSDADRTQYLATNKQQVDQSQQQLSNVPVALHAFQLAPYIFGPPLLQLLDASGGQTDVDKAFDQPPTTDEQLMDPPKFTSHEAALTVNEPALPDGVDAKSKKDSGDLGETTWYVFLAERIDPLQALQAADGWGGDAYVAYDQGGKTCVRADWRGDSAADDTEMQTALNAWMAAMPPGAATVTTANDTTELTACELGADSGLTLNNRALDALEFAGIRSQLALVLVQQEHVDIDKAVAFGDCVLHAVPFDQLVAANKGDDPTALAAARDAASACRSK